MAAARSNGGRVASNRWSWALRSRPTPCTTVDSCCEDRAGTARCRHGQHPSAFPAGCHLWIPANENRAVPERPSAAREAGRPTCPTLHAGAASTAPISTRPIALHFVHGGKQVRPADSQNRLQQPNRNETTSKALPLIHNLVRIRFCRFAGNWINENAVIGVVVLDHPVGRCHEQYTSAMGDSDH